VFEGRIHRYTTIGWSNVVVSADADPRSCSVHGHSRSCGTMDALASKGRQRPRRSNVGDRLRLQQPRMLL
jgi:hypothetical protein